jgi:hypothetical protein
MLNTITQDCSTESHGDLMKLERATTQIYQISSITKTGKSGDIWIEEYTDKSFLVRGNTQSHNAVAASLSTALCLSVVVASLSTALGSIADASDYPHSLSTSGTGLDAPCFTINAP